MQSSLIDHHSLAAAGHSLEAVHVVGAGGCGVFTAASARLVALLHVLEHLSTSVVAHLVGGSTEVSGEEGAERGDGGTDSGVARDLEWVGWSKEHRSVNLEALQIRVQKLTARVRVVSLERMASDPSWMRVI